MTLNGRIVRGGMGIEPDIQVPTELLSPFQSELLRLGLVSDFVQQVELPLTATIDDELIQIMAHRFMENFDPTRLQIWNDMLSLTDSLAHTLQNSNALNANTDESLQRITDQISTLAKSNFSEKIREIEVVLGLELIRFYKGNQAWKRASLAFDPAIMAGIQLLDDLQDYHSIID
jgi:hypothetical protein